MSIAPKKIAASLLLVLMSFSVALSVHAQQGGGVADPPRNGGGNNAAITSPIGNDVTITGVIVGLINWLLGISAVIALLALVVGGIRLIISFGNQEGVRTAKEIIKWAIIGLLVIGASFAIISLVTSDILGLQL